MDENANIMFDSVIKDDNITISVVEGAQPVSLSSYIEQWRCIIWEFGFGGLFKGPSVYTKAKSFKDYAPGELVVKRVLWRLVFSVIVYELRFVYLNQFLNPKFVLSDPN